MFGVLAVLAALGAVGACRSGHDESPPQSTGAVTLALTGTLNGVTYRLRGARFAIAQAGPDLVLDSDRDPAATFLTTTLPTGAYAINLEPGWALERSDTLQVVEATLTSPNPTPFQILADGTSNVIYRFSTSGGVVTVTTISPASPTSGIPKSRGDVPRTIPSSKSGYTLLTAPFCASFRSGLPMTSIAPNVYGPFVAPGDHTLERRRSVHSVPVGSSRTSRTPV